MPAPGVDAAAIVKTLLDNGVRFVVVGGFALELWDVAVLPTIDVDITPEQSKRNMGMLAAALNELDAGLRFGDETVRIPGGFTASNLEEMRVLNLSTSAGPLDLTLVPAGTGGYDDLARNASRVEFQGVSVPTAALEDVARSKEMAGRPKDLMALPAIRAHLERRRER
jgi:hypothetical protein